MPHAHRPSRPRCRPHPRPVLLPVLLPLLLPLLAVAACGAPDSALQLRLVPDPLLNSERQILAALDTLELIFDASGGFAGVAGAGQRVGDMVAVDSDGDGMFELALRRELRGRETLPLLRVLPGRNGDRGFQITAHGLAGGVVAAVGGLSFARFASGATLDLLVPFNLRASHRPPRVLLTFPHDGQSAPSAIDRIYVEFSKVIDTTSTTGNLRLVYHGAAGDRPVPGEWAFETSTVLDLGLPDERTAATLHLPASCPLNPGSYRIEVARGVRDRGGATLDQDATGVGDDGFNASFTVPGTPLAEPCAPSVVGCARDTECNKDTTTKDFVCNVPSGKCLPAGTDCKTLGCPTGYVCQTGNTAQLQCVADCRVAGLCGGAKDYCDEKTGVCMPCTAAAPSPKCGAVTEDVKCVFNNTKDVQKCSSARGACSGVASCLATVTGQLGEKLVWTSACAGSATTVIDGVAEYATFDCAAPPPPPPPPGVSEDVTCVFSKTTVIQECYSDKSASCKGLGSCVAKVSGTKGDKVLWKSSCGGYATTVIDGVAEKIEFICP